MLYAKHNNLAKHMAGHHVGSGHTLLPREEGSNFLWPQWPRYFSTRARKLNFHTSWVHPNAHSDTNKIGATILSQESNMESSGVLSSICCFFSEELSYCFICFEIRSSNDFHTILTSHRSVKYSQHIITSIPFFSKSAETWTAVLTEC